MSFNTFANIIDYIFNTLLKYNPIIQFYKYLETRPFPIEPFFHQVEILARCILRDPIRILIGDEIGLGKTITAIILGKYLQEVGRINKILVLVPRILVPQWIEEITYWIESQYVNQIERENIESYKIKGFPDGWYVISMALFARNKEIREAILNVEWDLIIVDEAHKISPQTAKKSWRYIGEELIFKHPQRNVFLLSATPHKGFPDDYIARLKLLDPNLKKLKISELDNKHFYKQTWNTLVFRRMKQDVNSIYEKREIFKPAHLQAILIRPSELEAKFYKEAESFLLNLLKKYKEVSGERLSALKLLVTLLAKRTFSSPPSAYSTLLFMTTKRAALLKRIDKKEAEKKANYLRKLIIKHLAEDYTSEHIIFSNKDKEILKEIIDAKEPALEDILNAFANYTSVLLDENDIKQLEKLRELADKVKDSDAKIFKLKELVKYYLEKGSKIIIFTEYADTANYIFEKLKKSIGYPIKVFTGGLNIKEERKDVEENFIKGDKYRVLVSTDVLSEGLNLQVSNVLINYDLPWSPLKLEQRIGRIWRLGQKDECYIYMLVVGSSEEATGASRVVSKLYTKLLNMERAQLGKVTPILGEDVEVYDRDLLKKTNNGTSLYVATKETKKGKKFITDVDIIIASLDDEKFKEFVNKYIKAVKDLERRISENNVKPETSNKIVDDIVDVIGFQSQTDIKSLLLDLTRTIATIKGKLITLSENKEFIKDSFHQKSIQDMTPKELIKIIQDLTKNKYEFIKPISINIWDNDGESKLYIFKIPLLIGDKVRYEEVIGIEEKTGKILNSIELLRTIIKVHNKPYYISTLDSKLNETKVWFDSLIYKYFKKKLFVQTLQDIKNYIERIQSKNLRSNIKLSKVFSYEEVQSEPILIGILNFIQGYSEYASILEQFVGEYDKEKLETEKEAISIIKNKFGQEFSIQDLHESIPVFDLIFIKNIKDEPKEYRLVEVKSWKYIDLIIYTENEKKFGEENESKGGNYWLYVVDMRREPAVIMGFKRPFTTNALQLVRKISKDGKDYYVYRLLRNPDEIR